MQLGLFTTDNVILETLFFFMTQSVIYSMVVVIYEDIIIREENISVGLMAICLKTVYDCVLDVVTRFICLPSYIDIWSNPEIEGGKEDCANFFGGLLLVATCLGLVAFIVGGLFFGVNYLLVDAGAGYYCKMY